MGKTFLLGLIHGLSDRPSDEANDLINNIIDNNFQLHVYLVGPGMWSWSKDEQRQVTQHAKSIGIDVTKSNWHKREWLDWGWLAKAKEQFLYYDSLGAYSCEIDNLDSAIGYDPDKTISSFMELQKFCVTNGITTKLMIKNLDENQLLRLINEVTSGSIQNNFLADWGMFEKGTGEPERQIELCKKIGIYAVTPISGITDTNHYGVVKDGVPSLASVGE